MIKTQKECRGSNSPGADIKKVTRKLKNDLKKVRKKRDDLRVKLTELDNKIKVMHSENVEAPFMVDLCNPKLRKKSLFDSLFLEYTVHKYPQEEIDDALDNHRTRSESFGVDPKNLFSRELDRLYYYIKWNEKKMRKVFERELKLLLSGKYDDQVLDDALEWRREHPEDTWYIGNRS